MSVCGIIAEYDPFHFGHQYQLNEARAKTGADFVVCVLSTAFLQRGTPSLLPLSARAEAALFGGADVVLSLPAVFSCAPAERFAFGAVSILNALGVVDFLSFGCETPDENALGRAADTLETQDDDFREALKQFLSQGLSYPDAQACALYAVQPDLTGVLDGANNLLGISYLRAIRRLGSPMRVCPVLRRGEHDQVNTEGFESASQLRTAILAGDDVHLPVGTQRVLQKCIREGSLCRPDALDQALLYRLYELEKTGFDALPDLSEGIENRLKNALQSAKTREELIMAAKTRRYPYARLSRLCAAALMGFPKELPKAPCYTRLLGMRERAKPLMHQMKLQSSIRVIAKPADEKELLAQDACAERVRALGTGAPCDFFTSGMICIKE